MSQEERPHPSTTTPWIRAIAVWALLLVIAVLNGAARDALIAPQLGERSAHWVSTVVLCVFIFLVSRASIGWIHPRTTGEALAVGLLWVLLTVAFEFLAGHYLFGTPWEKLLADYDVRGGRVWILVLVSNLLAPAWAAATARSTRSPSTP